MAELKDLIVNGPSVFIGETNVSTPTANTQIANKQYVDSKSAPAVTASDNGKVLMVVNGTWAAASLPTYDGSVT